MQNRNIAQDEYGSFALGIKALVKGFKIFFAMLLGAIFLMLIYFVTFNGYFEADSGHAVVLLRFGKYLETYPAASGGRWYFPEPISRKIKIPTTIQYLEIGFKEKLIDPKRPNYSLAPSDNDYLITGDTNIVLMGWIIGSQIENPEKFFKKCYGDDFSTNQTVGSVNNQSTIDLKSLNIMLINSFRDSVIKVTASNNISKVINNVTDFRIDVEREFRKSVEKLDIGVIITSVNLPKVPRPPLALKDAFSDVSSIDTKTQGVIDKAYEDVNRINEETATEANKVIADAKAYKTRIVQSTIAENIRFEKIYVQYKEAPEAVVLTLLNNTLAEVLGQIDRKYIISRNKGKQQVRIKINPEVEKISQEELIKRAIEMESKK